MGKYSSDSDSEKRSIKSSSKGRNRRRSSSSSSNSSSSRNKRRKGRTRRSRSKSRGRYSRRSRSRTPSDYRSSRYKPYRSDSRDRYRERHRRSRSHSKDKYRSRRSRSKSYIREFVSKPRKPSTSDSTSSDDEKELTKTKTLPSAPKLGETSKITETNKNGKVSPDCVIVDNKVLEDINEDKFIPKPFNSSKSKNVPDNIVIDLTKNTIKVPEVEKLEPDSIFHHNLFMNEEARMEKWVKELYSFRQKALQQGLRNDH